MVSENTETVLIVNDDPDQRELMSALLRRSGYRIAVAKDGIEGFEEASRTCPALVISDVLMPRANGIELCLSLRADPTFKTTPILLVSALRKDAADVLEGFRAGADEYVEVPYEPMRLVAQVARLLERARAEKSLRESEERYRSLVRASSQVVWTANAEGEVIGDLPYWREITGQSEDEVQGRGRLDAMHPEDIERVAGEWARAVETRSLYSTVFRVRARAGGYRYFADRAVPILDEHGEVHEWVGASSDITERKEAEEALRESEEGYRLLFESNPHPMWVIDRETLRFLTVNDAAVRHYGYTREEFLSMTTLDIRPAEHIPALLEHLSKVGHGIEKSGVWKHSKKSGELIEVETTSHMLVFGGREARLVMAEDVTEHRRAQQALREREEQLRHSQKMDAVRSLARGIAHDFNNQMAIVTGYCDLLLRQLGPDERARKKVREIRDAASRAAVLTRQLLTFSRREIAQPVVMNPNTLVSSMEDMLRPWIGDHIEIKTTRQPDIGHVKADPNQLAQVLMTLAINARDAMPQGGEITIETSQVRLGATSGAPAPVRSGDYVLILVRDTGQGMDAETAENIFEPFYSTKEMGTGLGLYTAHNIVMEAGGYIWVHSQPRQGTTFEIYLPQAEESAKSEIHTTALSELPGGSETVLLVEDKSRLLRMTTEMLEVLGYRVLEASNGQAAIEVYERHDGPIQLLLTDVSMPRMNGLQLAERLTRLCPETKVLYMTGHAGPTADDPAALAESTPYLEKPFTLSKLARTLRETLDK